MYAEIEWMTSKCPSSPTPSRSDTPLSFISVTPSIQTEEQDNDDTAQRELDLELETSDTLCNNAQWPRCIYCKQIFSNLESRSKHMREIHANKFLTNGDQEKDPNDFPWICGAPLKNDDGLSVGLCNQNFKMLRDLVDHKRKTHSKIYCKSDECGQHFGEKSDLPKHRRRPLKKPKSLTYLKTKCSQSISSRQDIQNHSKMNNFRMIKGQKRVMFPKNSNNKKLSENFQRYTIDFVRPVNQKMDEMIEPIEDKDSNKSKVQEISIDRTLLSIENQDKCSNQKEETQSIFGNKQSVPNMIKPLKEKQNKSGPLNNKVNVKRPQMLHEVEKETSNRGTLQGTQPKIMHLEEELQSCPDSPDPPVFNWYSLVAKHNTTRFGIVPLPPKSLQQQLGPSLFFEEKTKQGLRIEIPVKFLNNHTKAFVEVETLVYVNKDNYDTKKYSEDL